MKGKNKYLEVERSPPATQPTTSLKVTSLVGDKPAPIQSENLWHFIAGPKEMFVYS